MRKLRDSTTTTFVFFSSGESRALEDFGSLSVWIRIFSRLGEGRMSEHLLVSFFFPWFHHNELLPHAIGIPHLHKHFLHRPSCIPEFAL